MKKNERITAFMATLPSSPASDLDRRYLGYFACFNDGRYYDAHDVLENLWLENDSPDGAFFKGLIQLAGAFVHLQKQAARPDHPKDGRRLQPAYRLFALAAGNLDAYRPHHWDLDVSEICALCEKWMSDLEVHQFSQNPWSTESAPRLALMNS